MKVGQVDDLIYSAAKDSGISRSACVTARIIGEVFGVTVADRGKAKYFAMQDLATDVRNALPGDDQLRTDIFVGERFDTSAKVADYKSTVADRGTPKAKPVVKSNQTPAPKAQATGMKLTAIDGLVAATVAEMDNATLKAWAKAIKAERTARKA
jgi:hypothetical protein